MPPRPQGRGMAKPKNTKKTLGRVLRFLSEYKIHMIVAALCIAVSSVAGVLGTYFLKPAVNDYLVPFIGAENVDLSGFISMLGTLLIIYLSGAAATYLYNYLMMVISSGTLNRLRREMFDHMQDLPVSYFDTRTHGEIMSRYTNDTDTLREFLSQSLPSTLSSSISLITTFVMMLVVSPLLTLLVLLMLPINMLVIKFVGGKSGAYFMAQQKAVGAMNGYIEETIEGQKVVQVFTHEETAKGDFGKLNETLCHASTNANTFGSVLFPIMGNLSYFQYAVTAAAGAGLMLAGYLDLGSLIVFLQYTRSFSQPITQLSQQFNAILVALAGAERIFDLMDAPAETDEGYVELVDAKREENGALTESDAHTGLWAWKHPHKDGSPTTYTELKGDVVFEDVTFGYVPEKTVLHDISLFAKPGQKIAFVGSTGAGKTTITNLINRFYDLTSGKIRYDGINIEKIRKSDLRRSLAMVLQDTHLFTGTVRDNIRYGKLDATDEEIERAARVANAHFFIEHLPQGYDTLITGDGANLSQGQRQLLAIARAAVADPPVLILDEATSSIDTRTEALIERGMDELMKGRTVFVIAHRLSTVRNSQAIMVLEDGRIIERGDHEQLLAMKGKYYQLYTGMFELS